MFSIDGKMIKYTFLINQKRSYSNLKNPIDISFMSNNSILESNLYIATSDMLLVLVNLQDFRDQLIVVKRIVSDKFNFFIRRFEYGKINIMLILNEIFIITKYC